MDNPHLLVIRPIAKSADRPWFIRMDRISAYHPEHDDTEAVILSLIVDGNILKFNESTQGAFILTEKWAKVSWEEVHMAIMGHLADEQFYAELAVNNALSEKH